MKHQITQVTQPPYSTDLATHDFWLFPKLKTPLIERGEISDHQGDSGKYDGVADGDWKNYVSTLKGSSLNGTTSNGTEASLSYVQCFLYLVSSLINVCIFHSTWVDTFWTDLIYTMEYYSAIQKKEILPFVTWMDLGGVMLSEISQRKKNAI